VVGRGTQVVRERSAKPLCVGSIPTRASRFFLQLPEIPVLSTVPALRSRSASIGENRAGMASGADKKRTSFAAVNSACFSNALRLGKHHLKTVEVHNSPNSRLFGLRPTVAAGFLGPANEASLDICPFAPFSSDSGEHTDLPR
jgi:hypothetical protein